MKPLTDNELWNRVRKLQGKVISTPDLKRPNKIMKVTDNSVIFDRPSSLAKEDFLKCYRLVIQHHILTNNNTPPDFFYRRIARVCYALLAEAVPEQIRAFSRRESPPAAQGLSGIEVKGRYS